MTRLSFHVLLFLLKKELIVLWGGQEITERGIILNHGGRMAGSNKEELLKDEQVRQEIDRYKWVESEKAGYDIGFCQ